MISRIQSSFMRLAQTQKALFSKTPQFIKMHTADFLLNDDPKPRKRTKTVCTIGPKTQNSENAGKLIDEGLSVARLNFSHGDHEQHRQQMLGVEQALSKRPNSHASILLDTKGPQIRTGNNKDGQQIQLKKGQLLQITTDYEHEGTSERIACSYKSLCQSTEVGKKILIADGGVSTVVKKIQKQIVTVEVLNDGKIGSRKNMCLPGCVITLPTITQYDKYDILDFGVKYKVDYIAVSFARYRSDLENLRSLLTERDPEHGPHIQLVSKIQNHEAIHNLDQIIDASDGIMIARGDLGMQVPIEKVVVLQKYITDRTINQGKFVITATQMLQSMETKPRPTRAQVSDITNSVYDLADANMTSGETTNGQFPFQCAKYLKLIAQQAEASCDYQSIFEHRKNLINDRQAVGAISLSFELDCHFIFIQTENVRLINRLSSLRPKAYIIVFTDDKRVKNAVAINFGVYVYPKDEYGHPNKFIKGHGENYGIKTKQTARVLSLEQQNSKIVSSRIFEIN